MWFAGRDEAVAADILRNGSRYLWAHYKHMPAMAGWYDNGVSSTVGAQSGTNKLGSYYCWNRTYDINLGRWTSPDPAASPWSNLLVYVANGPLSKNDPSGLDSVGYSDISEKEAYKVHVWEDLRDAINSWDTYQSLPTSEWGPFEKKLLDVFPNSQSIPRNLSRTCTPKARSYDGREAPLENSDAPPASNTSESCYFEDIVGPHSIELKGSVSIKNRNKALSGVAVIPWNGLLAAALPPVQNMMGKAATSARNNGAAGIRFDILSIQRLRHTRRYDFSGMARYTLTGYHYCWCSDTLLQVDYTFEKYIDVMYLITWDEVHYVLTYDLAQKR